MAINMSFFNGNISRRVIRQVRRRGFSIGDKGHSLCSLGDPCILLNRLVNDPISRPFCMAIVVNNFISVYEGYSWISTRFLLYILIADYSSNNFGVI